MAESNNNATPETAKAAVKGQANAKAKAAGEQRPEAAEAVRRVANAASATNGRGSDGAAYAAADGAAGAQATLQSEGLRRVFAARRGMVATAAWMLLLVLALVAATYAWFSSSRFTNVTPTAHTVSENGYDLLISANEGGPFDTECTLAAADKTLYPVSTSDLTNFWRASFQNASGITTEYANCTSQVDDYILQGTFYLKGSSAPLAVYLYQSRMNVTSDPQLLAALRVGFVIQSSQGTQTYIFSCDDLGSTAGATSQRTTVQDNVAVAGSGAWQYVADPSQAIGSYTMDGEGDAPVARVGAQPLFTLAADEVASVRYFVYMEGCDPNCINEAQSKNLTLQFAFAGAKA